MDGGLSSGGAHHLSRAGSVPAPLPLRFRETHIWRQMVRGCPKIDGTSRALVGFEAVFNQSDAYLDELEGIGTSEDDSPPGPGGAPSPMPSPMPPGPVTPLPLPLPGDRSLVMGAGKALVFVTGGLVLGWIAGGPVGGAAGAVTVGALRNLARTKDCWSSSSPDERAEAGKSLTMGIVGLGLATMLGYQAYKMKTESE